MGVTFGGVGCCLYDFSVIPKSKSLIFSSFGTFGNIMFLDSYVYVLYLD